MWAETGRAAAMDEDTISQALWRVVQAQVLGTRGEHARAGRLADEAVALMDTAQQPSWEAEVLVRRAAVHELAGRTDHALADVRRAVALFDAKGDVPGGRRGRRQVEELLAR
jgi:hypothetical protein